MGLYQVLRSVGLSLGSALAAAILITFTPHGHIYPSYEGFRVTLVVATALCAATAVVSYLLPGKSIGAPPTEVVEMMKTGAETEGLLLLGDDPLAGEPTRSGR
jgi:hypothetical protein